jgi:Mn2+/Fe2+ NRAMP family transporter
MRVAVYTERDTRSGESRDKQTVTGTASGMGSATGIGTSSMVTEINPSRTDPKKTEPTTPEIAITTTESAGEGARDLEVQDVEWIDMANGWVVGTIGWLIWTFIAGLNVYLIVMLGLGRG